MGNPLVSIIIPVFNAQNTLRAALESVIEQTLKDKELLVIDGGSNDDSQNIINQHLTHISHFISEPDHGVYDAINKGIEKAKGEWIYVLGADDKLQHPEILTSVFANVSLGCNLIFGDVINTHGAHMLVKKQHHSQFGSGLLFRNTLHQQSAFYHRSLFKNFRFNTSYKILADYDFHLKLYQEKTTHFEVDLVIAECQARGLSKNFSWSLYAEEIRMKNKRLGLLLYSINIPWIVMKFLVKKIFS